MMSVTKFFILAIIGLNVVSAFPERIAYKQTPAPTPISYGITPNSGAKSASTPPPVPPRSSTPAGPANPFNLTFVVAARDLPVKKKGAKIDPYIKVFHRTGTLQEQKDWAPIGQTETLKENNNPDFLKVFS